MFPVCEELFLNNKLEILAPCGSLDSVYAAVRMGADAVYIGLSRFSAREYAANFDDDALSEALRYCRLHGVKVHVAINTLIRDDEFDAALSEAVKAYRLGADAFIVQDNGLAEMIRLACPEAALHASTQMTVHTPAGARLLRQSGFDRVVLAREMSREEIAGVVKGCRVETEVFVHGALCMCVSGQCYLSAMLGGRSGNRGRCAQPCRLPFSVKGGTGHDLSLKDNCTIDHLGDMAKLGVTSAKIEGRMKRPEYTAAAVKACRTAVDEGRSDPEEIETLRKVFSRSGFTDGYYTAHRGREMFGTRSKEDVTSATGKLLAQIRTLYKDEKQTRSAAFTLKLKAGSPAQLTSECGGQTALAQGAEPETARTAPMTAEKAEKLLRKTGGTAFYADKINCVIDDGVTVSASQINEMRRTVLAELSEKLSAAPKRALGSVPVSKLKPHDAKIGAPTIRAIFADCDIPDGFKRCEIVFVPLNAKPEEIARLKRDGFNVGVKLPRVFFGGEERVKKLLCNAAELGITDAYCGSIGAAAAALEADFTVHGGSSLNIFNTHSLAYYQGLGLQDSEVSIELTSEQINRLGGSIPRGIAAYGHLPLMITRNCPGANGGGCRRCGGKNKLTDRKGIDFTLMCSFGCTEVLNPDALVLSDRLSRFENIDFASLHFTYEKRSEREEILEMYERRRKPDFKCTAGLYFRGVM